MNKIVLAFIALTLVGSPAYAAGEPISGFLMCSKRAEKTKDYRTSIYCRAAVLLELINSRSAKGLEFRDSFSALIDSYQKAGLIEKVKIVRSLKGKKLAAFLEREVKIADPSKSISMYSDGTFVLTLNHEKLPIPGRSEFYSSPNMVPLVVTRSDPSYTDTLKDYWWFKVPTQAEIQKLPQYTVPAKTVLDGAFTSP